MVFEVGKSRPEALLESGETVALLRYYADAMERNDGFIREMGRSIPDDPDEHNASVLRPYGVWVVLSPFNFPVALSAASVAAPLMTGNTVVSKAGSDTPLGGWKTAQLFADARLPDGVFNYLSGRGSLVGQELEDNRDVNGWTFTGSHEVDMAILKRAVSGRYPVAISLVDRSIPGYWETRGHSDTAQIKPRGVLDVNSGEWRRIPGGEVTEFVG